MRTHLEKGKTQRHHEAALIPHRQPFKPDLTAIQRSNTDERSLFLTSIQPFSETTSSLLRVVGTLSLSQVWCGECHTLQMLPVCHSVTHLSSHRERKALLRKVTVLTSALLCPPRATRVHQTTWHINDYHQLNWFKVRRLLRKSNCVAEPQDCNGTRPAACQTYKQNMAVHAVLKSHYGSL